jgi:outer membrane protein with beta-barrel domain
MRRVLSLQFSVLSRPYRDDRLDSPRSEVPLREQVQPWSASVLRLALVLCALANFAHGQQVDFGLNGSTLWSPKPLTSSQAYVPPAESGGTYAGASLQYFGQRRWGLNIEGAFRAKEGLYNGYQHYRPILYDANIVYPYRLAAKTRADFMAGIGGQTVLFYNTTNCGFVAGCRTYVDSTHFLIHAGFGVRYYFWRTFFIRPEAHYYFIPNNFEFHSDHVFRLGATIGHTFGSK